MPILYLTIPSLISLQKFQISLPNMYLPSDEMLHCHQPSPILMDRRWKSSFELAPNCPRCASSNTKFCYYNNYSLSQPRYFCKGCRRYWTKGGSLRNVPVGGGCRKTRRTKAIRPSTSGGTTLCTDDGSLSPCLGINDPSSSGPPVCGYDGPDIDLATVFAKFVNRTEETNPILSDVSVSPNQDTRLEDMLAKCQTQSSTADEVEQLFPGFGEGFPCGDHILQEGQSQEFSGYDDSNSFGLQTMLSNELVQDIMWSDSTAFTNFSWEPMLQLQEFGSFPCDVQSKISANVSDNWSLFDLPAYEILSRP